MAKSKQEAEAPPAEETSDVDAERFIYPPEQSAGYLIRQAHRAFQRALERRIQPRGVPRGQWYFLRVLWEMDGMTQRELSLRVGTMEPTTIVALRNMEKSGLVRRQRDDQDRRKTLVYLTEKGRKLRNELLPLAKDVNDTAYAGVSEKELEIVRRVLKKMTRNFEAEEE